MISKLTVPETPLKKAKIEESHVRSEKLPESKTVKFDKKSNTGQEALQARLTQMIAEADANDDEEDEEESEKIRCICEEHDSDDVGRTMICCDRCEVWQHKDCMDLTDDYDPPEYFCERCKPGHHKKLLGAVKKGEKPWVDAARRRIQKQLLRARSQNGRQDDAGVI